MNKTTDEVHIYKRVHGPYIAFRDRFDAGRQMAAKLRLKTNQSCLVLGLPRGGIPVGESISSQFGCSLEPVLVRKLPIPTSSEMGFGAVAVDGSVILNDNIMNIFAVTRPEIERVVQEPVSTGRHGAPPLERQRIFY